MSEALEFLVKARPTAMTSYFKFLKEAGQHLDPKTRDLISVITKVHSQTENGLRQYLSRALRGGCTPNEVIDALLMAFPALGLAKIVWAAEIILDMDIPEFRPESLNGEAHWHDVVAAEEVPDKEVSYYDCDGRSLFVYRADSDYRVYDSRCPHQVTNIPHLALKGKLLTCPKHSWAFDVRTGKCVQKGTHPLKHFSSKLEEGRLMAHW